MKKSQRLFLGVIVLAILLGVYIYAKSVPQGSDTSNQRVSIEIAKINKEKIKQIDIKAVAANFSLTKEDGKWKIVGDNSELNESAINSMLEALSTINAERLISETPTDAEEYGLGQPDKIISVIFDSGEQKNIEIGTKTLGGNSYYLKLKDNIRIYTVSSDFVDKFNITPDSLKASSETGSQEQTNNAN